jgi:hypothetical protein
MTIFSVFHLLLLLCDEGEIWVGVVEGGSNPFETEKGTARFVAELGEKLRHISRNSITCLTLKTTNILKRRKEREREEKRLKVFELLIKREADFYGRWGEGVIYIKI